MQIILMEKVTNLGQLGDIVKVKSGFARNYLIPQGKAKRATEQGPSPIFNPGVPNWRKNRRLLWRRHKPLRPSSTDCWCKFHRKSAATASYSVR